MGVILRELPVHAIRSLVNLPPRVERVIFPQGQMAPGYPGSLNLPRCIISSHDHLFRGHPCAAGGGGAYTYAVKPPWTGVYWYHFTFKC